MSLRLFVASALFAVSATTVTASAQSVNIYNDSGQDVLEFYATSAGSNGWGRDRLGSGVIPHGYNQTFPVRDGSSCRFDTKVVMANGRELVQWNWDLCNGARWTIR